MSYPPMNTDLNNTERDILNRAMSDILQGLAIMHAELDSIVNVVSAAKFDELRAPIGTIRDAQWRIAQVLFNTRVREMDDPTAPTSGFPDWMDPADVAAAQRVDYRVRPMLQMLGECGPTCSCRGGDPK